MSDSYLLAVPPRYVHTWLRKLNVSFVPGPLTRSLHEVVNRLLERFHTLGHKVQPSPEKDTDLILTTAPFGEPISWREALLFTVRHRYRMRHNPVIYTLLHVSRGRFRRFLEHLKKALGRESPCREDYDFPGLVPHAYKTIYEQGRRGGPILALERILQAQAKSIRILLVVGDERPIEAYNFDLVGAHPRTDASDPQFFYDDIVLRMVTAASTGQVTEHQVVGDPIPYTLWQSLKTPSAMYQAAKQLGSRNFFTDAVRISDLVHVPVFTEVIAAQYSEGCFATWDASLNALVSTITGSARPLDKYNVTENDLTVIVGVRPDGKGALVRHVEGKRNDPPSSEAVEMMNMDGYLPRITLEVESGRRVDVPVVRSKLHGHRGVAAYDPRRVEYTPLEEPYLHYPVSCSTDAQARAIVEAFARAQSLQNPDDPRQIAFTVLPGHGIMIAEKWVPGKAPFQIVWEYMDAGYLQIENLIPQGPFSYEESQDGRLVRSYSDSLTI